MSGGFCRRAAGARPAEPPAAVLLHKTVDFAVVGGMASSRCRRQATAAKTTAQEKRKLLDPAAPAPASLEGGIAAARRSPWEESRRASDFRAFGREINM